jgi:hypothetical protein
VVVINTPPVIQILTQKRGWVFSGIREVLGSILDLSWKRCCVVSLNLSTQMLRLWLKADDDHFLPKIFQFIIHAPIMCRTAPLNDPRTKSRYNIQHTGHWNIPWKCRVLSTFDDAFLWVLVPCRHVGRY